MRLYFVILIMGSNIGTIYWVSNSDDDLNIRNNIRRIAKKYNLERNQGYYKEGMISETYGVSGLSLLWNLNSKQKIRNFLMECSDFLNLLQIKHETSFYDG